MGKCFSTAAHDIKPVNILTPDREEIRNSITTTLSSRTVPTVVIQSSTNTNTATNSTAAGSTWLNNDDGHSQDITGMSFKHPTNTNSIKNNGYSNGNNGNGNDNNLLSNIKFPTQQP